MALPEQYAYELARSDQWACLSAEEADECVAELKVFRRSLGGVESGARTKDSGCRVRFAISSRGRVAVVAVGMTYRGCPG